MAKRMKYVVVSYGLDGDENYGHSTIKDVKDDLSAMSSDLEFGAPKPRKGFPLILEFLGSIEVNCVGVNMKDRTFDLNGETHKF